MASINVSKTSFYVGDTIQIKGIFTEEEKERITPNSLNYYYHNGIAQKTIKLNAKIDEVVEFTMPASYFGRPDSRINLYYQDSHDGTFKFVNQPVTILLKELPALTAKGFIVENDTIHESSITGRVQLGNSMLLDKFEVYVELQDIPSDIDVKIKSVEWGLPYNRSLKTTRPDGRIDVMGYFNTGNINFRAVTTISAPGYSDRNLVIVRCDCVFDNTEFKKQITVRKINRKEFPEWTDSVRDFETDYILDYGNIPDKLLVGLNKNHKSTRVNTLTTTIDGITYRHEFDWATSSKTASVLYDHISVFPYVGKKTYEERYNVTFASIYGAPNGGVYVWDSFAFTEEVTREFKKSSIDLINTCKLRINPLTFSGKVGDKFDATIEFIGKNQRPDYPADFFTAGNWFWAYDNDFVAGTDTFKAEVGDKVRNLHNRYVYLNDKLFTKTQIINSDANCVITPTNKPVIKATVKLSETEIHIPWNSQKQITATVEGAPFGSQISYVWFSKPGYPEQQGNVYNVKTDEISRHNVSCQVTIVHQDYETTKIESPVCDMNIEKIKVVPVGAISLSHEVITPDLEFNARIKHDHSQEVPDSAISVTWFIDDVEYGYTQPINMKFTTNGTKVIKAIYKIDSSHYTSDPITLTKSVIVGKGIQDETVSIITRDVVPVGDKMHPQIIIENAAPDTVITYSWKVNEHVQASTENYIDYIPGATGLHQFECIATLKHPSYEDTIRATMFNVMVIDDTGDKEMKYPLHPLPHIDSAFGYGSWWSLDEVNSDPSGWRINGGLKYQGELNTYRYSLNNYNNFLIQESRNGKMIDKKKLESGKIY